MIISIEQHKERLDAFKRGRLFANLYASLESYEILAVEGEEKDIWIELRDYTRSLIKELQKDSKENKDP